MYYLKLCFGLYYWLNHTRHIVKLENKMTMNATLILIICCCLFLVTLKSVNTLNMEKEGVVHFDTPAKPE